MKNVLYITKLPIEAPWDEANKNLAYLLATQLKNYQIFLLTTKNGSSNDPNTTLERIIVYSKHNVDFFQKVRIMSWILSTGKKIDLIHSFFTPAGITSNMLRIAVSKHKARLIQTVPTVNFEKHSDYKTLLRADAVVAVSDYTADLLKKYGCANVHRIYPGVDLKRFSPADGHNTLRDSLGIALNAPVVLYAGEYKRLQSFDNLLRWMPLVAKKIPEVRFVLAVRIKFKSEFKIEYRIKKQIEQLGLKENVLIIRDIEDTAQLYNLATVNVLPAKTMAGKFDLPLSVLESMACGCPIIISENMVLKELFESNIGYQISYEDTKQWAEVVADLLKDQQKCTQIGAQGRRVAESKFNITDIAKQYEALYENIL
ncbi:MAG: glycosyltransferase family 4 protein [Candidatus Omnitrophota bacterium]